jgi:Calcineurin-like phosphoesterase
MASFRLLQITDLHISVPPDDIDLGGRMIWMSMQKVYPSRARRPVLEAVAAFSADMRDSVDLLLLSGDLADDGESRNLETALDFMEGVPAAVGSPFAANGLPTLGYSTSLDQRSLFVLPGNHDRFVGIFRAPGGTQFDAVFASHWRRGICGVQSVCIHKSGETLALVGADFCFRSMRSPPRNVWGQGLAEQSTIDALIFETNAIRKIYQGAYIIWTLHFPPILDVERELRLWNAQAVINAAQACNVTHIIAGHLHRTQEVTYSNVEVSCTGSAASELRVTYGNWLQLFQVDVNGGLGTLQSRKYRYEHSEASFVEV